MLNIQKIFPLSFFFIGMLTLMPGTKTSAQQAAVIQPPGQLVERTPRNPALPSIFIVGDSTGDFHTDPHREGAAAAQGWGVFLQSFFNPNLVNVVNTARSGRSSRTYITEGYWGDVMKMLKPKDVVLIQLGQNDVFPINDSTRARGTLPGYGPETQDIVNGVTHKPETVHTYGWYLRQIIQEAKSRGAEPVVLSLTPRNVWKNGHVEVGVGDYRAWARAVAIQEGNADFVDLSAIMAREYEKLGQAKVDGLYHDKEPVHLDTPGAFLAAELVVSGLKSALDAPVSRYLSLLGQMVTPADELAFKYPSNPTVPTLWVLGDSTVRNGDGTGIGSMWGWGDELARGVDASRLNISNVAVSGRSSRTYYTMNWPLLLPNILPGDFVLMQFGHNDLGNPKDPLRSRASLPGIGNETTTILNPITGREEVVHTYGWYLRQLISETRAVGAFPIICSPVPRNTWKGDKILLAAPEEWSKQVAEDQHLPFVDLGNLLKHHYEELGRLRTTALFADGGTHSTLEGARYAAGLVLHQLSLAGPPALQDRLRTGDPAVKIAPSNGP